MSNRAPKRCPACSDRRIQTYRHSINCWDDAEPIAWQCCGCGAILEPWGSRIEIAGYARVILPRGMKGAPRSYPGSKAP